MKMFSMIQAIAFSVFLFASSNAASNPQDFLVEMKIIDAGVEVAKPTMLVNEGVEASMSVSGDDGVAVGLVVRSSSETEAYVMAEVESGANKMSPNLLVKKGEWASVSVGELEFHVRVQHRAANR